MTDTGASVYAGASPVARRSYVWRNWPLVLSEYRKRLPLLERGLHEAFFHQGQDAKEAAPMANNPRRTNSHRRNPLRGRLKAEGHPRWICKAIERHGRIAHDLPPTHPYAFEVNELVPVSEYWFGGHQDPRRRRHSRHWENTGLTITSPQPARRDNVTPPRLRVDSNPLHNTCI